MQMTKVDELKIHRFCELKTDHGERPWKIIKSKADRKDARTLMRQAAEWTDAVISMVRQNSGNKFKDDNDIAETILAYLKGNPETPRDKLILELH